MVSVLGTELNTIKYSFFFHYFALVFLSLIFTELFLMAVGFFNCWAFLFILSLKAVFIPSGLRHLCVSEQLG